MRRLFKKGDITSNQTVMLVTLLLAALAVSVLAYEIYSIVRNSANKGSCLIEGTAADVSAKQHEGFFASIFASSNYQFSCPVKSVYIKKSDVAAIRTFDKDSQIRQFNYTQNDFGSEEKIIRFNVDKQISKEVNDCWQKTGDRDIFAKYLKIDTNELQRKNPTFFRESWANIKSLFGVEVQAPPVFCAVCAKIQFDDDLKASLSGQYHLDEYLKRHPAPWTSDKSMYDALNNGQIVDPKKQLQKYTYSAAHPQAVVYFKRYGFNYKPQEKAYSFLKDVLLTAGTGGATLAAAKIPLATIKTMGMTGVLATTGLAQSENSVIRSIFSGINPQGTFPDEYGVAVFNYEDVSYYCDVLANSYE